MVIAAAMVGSQAEELSGQSAASVDLQKALKTFADDIQASLASNPNESAGSRQVPAQATARNMLAQFRSALDRGDLTYIENSLVQLSAYIDSKPIRARLEELTSATRRERDEKQNRLAGEIGAALERAGVAVRNAQKPADLDKALEELAPDRQFSSSEPSAVLRAATAQIQPAYRFLVTWQDYLACVARRDFKSAHDALRNLHDQFIGLGWIPRSEILARMNGADVPKPEPQLRPDLRWRRRQPKSLPTLRPSMISMEQWNNFAY